MQIPAHGILCCGGNIHIHTDYRNPTWPLSKLERGPLTPTGTGFYCFSEHITWRMILIYHAQVHHRWLPFKDNKGQNTANYFKEKDVAAQGGSCSHSILGWFSTDFRKMKILSKHLLPQFRGGSFSKSKSHSSQSTMQAWFPTEEPIHGRGSCPPTSLPTGFSMSRGWATFPTFGTVPHSSVLPRTQIIPLSNV